MKIKRISKLSFVLLSLSAFFWIAPCVLYTQTIQSPEEFIGHKVGADYKLAPYDVNKINIHDLSIKSC